jgi:hypothetical protein
MYTDVFQRPLLNRIRSDIMFKFCIFVVVETQLTAPTYPLLNCSNIWHKFKILVPQAKPKQDPYHSTLRGPNESPAAHELFYTLPVVNVITDLNAQ